MRKKAFTLTEIVVVIVIIGFLATLGFPYYQSVVEDSKAKVCDANLKAQKKALDIYAMEHDSVPADLTQLSPNDIKRAFAEILKGKGAWKIKLAYSIVGWEQRGLAYAEFLTDIIAKGDKSMLTCPADSTPATKGGRSYGISSALANMSYQAYQNLPANTLLIGDCENATFTGATQLSETHKHPKLFTAANYAQAVSKETKVNEVSGGNAIPKGGGTYQSQSQSQSQED